MTNLKNNKTYNSLLKKSEDKGRMPSLKSVSKLLTELDIEHTLQGWEETRWRPNSLTYTTSGGTRNYTGYKLHIPEINLRANSCSTYYSYNTWSHARDIIRLIKSK
jgi:hypothetical protein